MKHGIFDYYTIEPFESFGLHSPFWSVHLDTLIYTWAAMGILFILAIVGRKLIKKELSYSSLVYEQTVSFFMTLCKESFGYFHYRYFAFITTLFLFTLMCCLVGLIPFLDESTRDLNTTFALGLSSFMYIQSQKIKTFGLFAYIKKFFQPIFLLAPINIIGELAKVASMSFRLFGNILGGSIIFGMIVNLVEQRPIVTFFLSFAIISFIMSWLIFNKKLIKNPTLIKIVNGCVAVVFFLVWAQMFFGIFEGLIQAFVLTMLTTTYLAMGTAKNSTD